MMKNFTLLVLVLFAFTVFSCQEEGQSVVQDTSNNFTKTSPISLLISRVSQYETTADNVLDGTSNCSIKLPAHVTVNGQYVYVSSKSDYLTVQNIKNLSTTDDDIVHFGYPITIVHPDHHEYAVTSESKFQSILAEYEDDSPYHEVSCLNFNYPISINIYNTSNQVASTISIQHDTQFYNFIHGLNDSQIVGIAFPLVMTNSNAEQMTINNNDALEDVINSAVTNCSSVSIPSSLQDVLTSGTWFVSYYFEDHDETYEYNGYNFTFNANGTSVAVKNTTTTNGDWDIHNGMPKRLSLHFDGSQLHDLETNWDVQEFTSTYIRLRKSGGGSGSEECPYLSFTKN